MPQLASIVLTDRATTPVNHTFQPRDIVAGVAEVVESTGVPIGDNSLTVSLKKPGANGSPRYKGVLKLVLPIVQTQTVNGVSTPVVVRTSYATVEFSFDKTSTEQERKDAVGMIQSALDPSKALVNDSLVKLQGVY